jgi:hypothetical protein
MWKIHHTIHRPQNRCVCFVGKYICLMNTSLGLKLVTSIIRDGFNNYKLQIVKPNMKREDSASLQMAPYIIRHFIVQAYARESKLVGLNIVTNVPGCVLIKKLQKIPNKIGFYKDCSFNIKGNEQAPVEVLLIQNEIIMRCIRKDAIKGQFDNDRYCQLHHTCTTINTKNGRMKRRYGSLFVKTFHYLVGSTSSDTILHLTGLQDSPIDECGYIRHSFKKDLKFPNNLVLEKEHKMEGSLYDHNKQEVERQRIKRHYNEWKSMSWDRKIDRERKDKQRRIDAGISEESAWETVCPRFQPN